MENYLFFTNSHDGTSALTAGISNIRVVCNNTLQMAIKGAKRTWSCKHTLNIDGRKQQAKEALGFAVKYINNLNDVAEKMAMQKINEEEFFRKLFEADAHTNNSKEKILERVHTIYHQKDDLQNFRGTAWGMYNAVADFCSNTTPLRATKKAGENRVVNFLDGYKLLETSQNLLMVA